MKNTSSKRNEKNTKEVKGYQLSDKVKLFGETGYITGFSKPNNGYIKSINGEYITIPNKKYKQVNLSSLQLDCRNNNWQFEQFIKDEKIEINPHPNCI